MAKIPFDLKYRPQIESGEYKVETRDGKSVRIICWDAIGPSPIIGLFLTDDGGETTTQNHPNGRWSDDLNYESDYDLFLITPEEELTEFENGMLRYLQEAANRKDDSEIVESTKKYAAELLSLAREQLIKDGYVIEKKAFHDAVANISDKHRAEMSVEYSIHCKVEDGTRHAIMNWEAFQKVAQKFINIGKADALKDRAVDLTKQLDESGFDENSIEYNLIEFMCNLMDCPNWSEIVETAGLYADRIKAAALKDLPRWDESQFEMDAPCVNLEWLHVGKKMIYLPDLEKLPGFKEDESYE